MPIGLGIATSHAPPMFRPSPEWGFDNLGVPQPRELELETDERTAEWARLRDQHFAQLARKIEDYGTELLVFIGGDQTESFDDSNVPNLMIYLGEEAVSSEWVARGDPRTPENEVRWKVDVETSRRLLHRLVREEDFDVAFGTEQYALGPRGGPDPLRMPHAFAMVARWLTPKMHLPHVLIWENTYDPPSLTAQRCYDFGRALARAFRDDPRRITIYGSGGLSHDPRGPRSGWIDKDLDHWFLDKLAQGRGQDTTALYTFDSATMRGGTGEIRAWITVAGAMEELGCRAQVIDYLAVHRTVTGLAWAYWETSPVLA
jgi:3-O-methylgallate 3,4-dioxygenase